MSRRRFKAPRVLGFASAHVEPVRKPGSQFVMVKRPLLKWAAPTGKTGLVKAQPKV